MKDGRDAFSLSPPVENVKCCIANNIVWKHIPDHVDYSRPFCSRRALKTGLFYHILRLASSNDNFNLLTYDRVLVL